MLASFPPISHHFLTNFAPISHQFPIKFLPIFRQYFFSVLIQFSPIFDQLSFNTWGVCLQLSTDFGRFPTNFRPILDTNFNQFPFKVWCICLQLLTNFRYIKINIKYQSNKININQFQPNLTNLNQS